MDDNANAFPNEWLASMPPRLADQLRYLVEADRLKTVIRGSRITDGSRKENAAEHSWHLTLFALVLAEWSVDPIDTMRVVQMLILHDIVEIEAGDLPLFEDHNAAAQAEREKEAAARLFGMLPTNQGSAYHAIWCEFEEGESADARFAKAVDRLQPMILNHLNRGGTWTDYQVDEGRVRRLTGKIERGSPELWRAAEAIFREATEGGWLAPSTLD